MKVYSIYELRREEEAVLADYSTLASVVIQNATLWDRLKHQPVLVAKLTPELTLRKCLSLATTNVLELCPCEGVRFIFSDEDTGVRIPSSVAVLAEILLRSPRKLFIFIIKTNTGSKYAKIHKFDFEKNFTDPQ